MDWVHDQDGRHSGTDGLYSREVFFNVYFIYTYKKINKTEIIYHACSFMSYWSGLYPPEMQGKILEGVKALLACVHRAVAVQPGNVPRILPAVTEEDKDEDAADE